MKVAIACTGVDQVQRGFERLFRDTFEVLRSDVDLTLFKGGGRSAPGEVRVPCTRRTGRLLKVLPLHRLAGRQPYQLECLTFGFGLHRALVRGGYDLVHCIDSPLAKALVRLRARAGAKYRILYLEGAGIPYEFQPAVDHVQYVAQPDAEDAVAHGFPAESVSYVPCGLHLDRFRCPDDRATLRERHGVPRDAFVILCVSALNREFKRVDHLVAEAARLDGEFLLWIDGSPEDAGLVREARERLGDRVRVTHMPSTAIPELYALADVLAHPACSETFGLVIVEAMSTGLPVLTHDSRHFRWLVGEPACLVDMAAEGALATRLAKLRGDRDALANLGRADDTWSRFDWSAVREEMRALYERALGAEIGTYRLTSA